MVFEWLEMQKSKWAESIAEKTKARLENNIFSLSGKRPITEITALEILWLPCEKLPGEVQCIPRINARQMLAV